MDKILIGIPNRGEMSSDLTMYLLNMKYPVTVLMDNDKWLSEARNNILQYGIINNEYTHLLFIDSDIYPARGSNILDKMLALDKDIVCAPYFMAPAADVTGEVSTRLVEFVQPEGGEEYYIHDLENSTENHEVTGWLPIGFSLIKLSVIRPLFETKWFGEYQCMQEDKTFAEKLLKHGVKFYYIAEKVNHRVRCVL